MTNFEKIKQMSVEDLATHNVRKVQVPTYANDGDGYIDEWEDEMYICSDGTMFASRRAAVIYEKEWLESEADNG